MPPPATLSTEDIQALLQSPQEKRLRVTEMMTEYYARGGFNESELATAGELLSVLAGDMEESVRLCLSEKIKHLDNVPPDIVIKLAQDVAEISMPVLEFSSLLTDEDLVEIVSSTQDAEKLKAVTRRGSVSEDVSDAIIDKGIRDVTANLLANDGADISGDGYHAILEKHAEDARLIDRVSLREALPVHVVERLVTGVSEQMRVRLQEKYGIGDEIISELLRDANDMTAVNLVAGGDSRAVYDRYMRFMRKHNFPDSFAPVLALCAGNLEVFVILAAKLLQTPIINVRCVLRDSGDKGFYELYRKMGLAPAWQEPCRVLCGILRDMTEKHGIKELYRDIFLKDKHARYFMHAFDEKAAKACKDKVALNTVTQLLRNTQLLAKKDAEENAGKHGEG